MKRKMIYQIFLMFTLILPAILSLSIVAYGQVSSPDTKFHIEPAIAYNIAYDDNIFLDRTGNKDIVQTLSPGIDLHYDTSPYFSIVGGYTLHHVIYHDFDKNNYDVHLPNISIDFTTPSHFYGRVEDFYKKTADPYGTENFYGEGTKTRRTNNKASLTLGYNISRSFSAEGKFSYNTLNFNNINDKWQDKNDMAYEFSVITDLTPKTSCSIRYQSISANYDKQNEGIDDWNKHTSQDNIKKKYLFGFHVDPRGKINGDLFIGYETRKFKNSMDKKGNNYSDSGTWATEIDIHYDFKSTSQFGLMLGRKINPSSLSGASSFINTTFELDYKQQLMRSYRISLATGMEIRDYDMSDQLSQPEQKYYIFTTDIGLSYSLKKWLTAEVHYRYKTREATEDYYNNMEYDNNIFSLNLSALF